MLPCLPHASRIKPGLPGASRGSGFGPRAAHPAISIPTPHPPTPCPAHTSEPLLCCSLIPGCPSSPSQLAKLLGILEGSIQTSCPWGDPSRYPTTTTSLRINLPTTDFLFCFEKLKALEKMNLHIPFTSVHRLLIFCHFCPLVLSLSLPPA